MISREDDDVQNDVEGGASKNGRGGMILYEFPLFRISYCGTDPNIQEAFSFVAKDSDGLCVIFLSYSGTSNSGHSERGQTSQQ